MRRWIAIVASLASAAVVALPVQAHGPAGAGWARTTWSAPAGTPASTTGTLRLYHIDDFADDVGADGYAVETAAGLTPLDIRGPAPEAMNGARVRVSGTWQDGVIRVGLARDATSLVQLRAAPRSRVHAVLGADGQSIVLADGAPVAAASKNVAVLLFDFSDDASQPYTSSLASQVAVTNGDAVANYFEEESRGAVTLTGQVFGWYQIAASKATCDPFAWATQAKAAATAAGVDLSPFTNYVYAFPRASSCAWAGLGAMPGKDSWNNGAFALRVVAHELGHNFGVHHASSLSCTSGSTRVSISATCSSSEYGDPFSVMGSGSTAHDNAVHLGQFGWLAGSEIRTVGPGGPYELGSVLDGPAGSDRLLRVDRHDGTSLYLDIRSVHPPNFDAFSPTDPVVNGVTIRISPDLPSPGYGLSQTQLVDTTPTTSSYADAPLAVGATLVDPVTGLRITTVSVAPGDATVSVADPTAPGAAGSPKATPTGATSIALTWTAAHDNYAVDHYRVLRDGIEVATPAGLSFTDTGRTPATTYAYRIVAVDGSANEGPAVSASAKTPPSGPDVTPPSAVRSLKAKLTSSSTKLYWTAATDDFGVAGYKVYRVGKIAPIKTVTTGKSVMLKRHRGTSYYVRAFDAAGNLGPKSPKRTT